MTHLGLWAPFINEREMLGWYQLPSEMAEEARRYRPNGHELDTLSARAYSALHQQTVAFVRQSVAPFRPTYHNDQMHFAATEAFGLAAADAYAAGSKRKMPTLVRQTLGLALRTHDAHHCASTFRIEAPRGMYRPELGTNVSTEWVTAQSVNRFMATQGLNLPARLFQTGVIWSSTYGGGTPTGNRLRVPNPQPTTVWGAIMRAADVCPPEKFGAWLRQTIAVNYGEVPAQPAPRTLSGFVTRSEGFASYIEHCFDRLDTTSDMSLTAGLGWRSRLASLRRGVAVIKSGDKRAIAIVQKEVSRYSLTLG
jgi:hypothetical protein